MGASSGGVAAGRGAWSRVALADLGDLAKAVSHGVYPGLLCGAVIGGLGGRLAMLLLRLTSADHLHGLRTDDGFRIGAVTFATVGFVLAMTAVGGAIGLLYPAVRLWLPSRWRPLWFGLPLAVMAGAAIINPSGIDFTFLSPRWLAVALFLLLPAAYGVSLSLLAERAAASGRIGRRWWRWPALATAALMVVAFGPLGLAVAAALLLACAGGQLGRLRALWVAAPLRWAGRAGLAVAVLSAGLALARDLRAIL